MWEHLMFVIKVFNLQLIILVWWAGPKIHSLIPFDIKDRCFSEKLVHGLIMSSTVTAARALMLEDTVLRIQAIVKSKRYQKSILHIKDKLQKRSCSKHKKKICILAEPISGAATKIYLIIFVAASEMGSAKMQTFFCVEPQRATISCCNKQSRKARIVS